MLTLCNKSTLFFVFPQVDVLSSKGSSFISSVRKAKQAFCLICDSRWVRYRLLAFNLSKAFLKLFVCVFLGDFGASELKWVCLAFLDKPCKWKAGNAFFSPHSQIFMSTTKSCHNLAYIWRSLIIQSGAVPIWQADSVSCKSGLWSWKTESQRCSVWS